MTWTYTVLLILRSTYNCSTSGTRTSGISGIMFGTVPLRLGQCARMAPKVVRRAATLGYFVVLGIFPLRLRQRARIAPKGSGQANYFLILRTDQGAEYCDQ